MRAIINTVSERAIEATGWRAREIKVDKTTATLADVLKAATLKDGKRSLYDLVTDQQGFRDDFSLFISGEFLRGKIDLGRVMVDSEQIHLWDWPFSVRDS